MNARAMFVKCSCNVGGGVSSCVYFQIENTGEHVHIGEFVVSAREASGFSNASVWVVLERKGLLRRNDPITATLTPDGLTYETGIADRFLEPSDH